MTQCKTLTFFLYFANLSFVTYSAAAAHQLLFAYRSLIIRSSFAHRSFALASTPSLPKFANSQIICTFAENTEYYVLYYHYQ